MRTDGLIFDLDGTLWDTSETCALAWNDVLARLGVAHRAMTGDDVRAVTGQPHAEAIRRAFQLDEADLLRVIEETALEDNRAIAKRGGALYPGVPETIPLLATHVPLFIVSNCQRGYIETFLACSGLASSFVDFECWGNTLRDKTENVRRVIERNGLRSPWFVGDTDGDRAAARGNGLRFAHVRWGFGALDDFDVRLDRFDELRALLE